MQIKQISTITHEEHALHLESPFQAYMHAVRCPYLEQDQGTI